MKKTIFALFVLLLLLMVTCVYHKMPIIYSNSAGKHIIPPDVIETDTVITNKESAKTPIAPVKEKIIVAKTIEKKSEVKTVVQNKQSTSAEIEKNTPKPQDITETDTVIASKEPAKTPVIPAKEKTIVVKTVEKKVEVKAVVQDEQPVSIQTPKRALSEGTKEEEEAEQTLLSKLKSAVLKRLRSRDQEEEEKFLEESKPAVRENTPAVQESTPSIQESTPSVQKNTPAVPENTPAAIENISLTVTYNTSEEEIVDQLVEAVKSQEQAFKNRDKFMLEIEALIKRALEDRFIAIENRKKEEQSREKAQKVRLEEREIVSKNIPQTYTTTPGE